MAEIQKRAPHFPEAPPAYSLLFQKLKTRPDRLFFLRYEYRLARHDHSQRFSGDLFHIVV